MISSSDKQPAMTYKIRQNKQYDDEQQINSNSKWP